MELVALDIASVTKNHGTMADTNQSAKGTPSDVGWALNPTWKTNHITNIVTSGWINAHAPPNNEPK
ncbi:hypothetical protein VCRA2117O37_100135 [Vibrio crassostreae]|nr:hypothetical protein VCRA2117O37_100135 [Vibrio crassostreae]CAK2233360.1 hypothetical protein VCRA2118O41_70137 [Vibrio crassostreae]CAK2270753.1 hypothetical protein VCRA2117O39_90137 [Vibrio crassostreae]CAK2576916.1 hypothetical protein VCRA2125O83_100141 [Vibrio crassostreae]CAK2577204.1 hypothetical protein VCRA2128O106_100140 [Vibrio crassostreae]